MSVPFARPKMLLQIAFFKKQKMKRVRNAKYLLESETCEGKEKVVGLGSIGRQGKLRSEVCIDSIQDSSLSPSWWKGSNVVSQAQGG